MLKLSRNGLFVPGPGETQDPDEHGRRRHRAVADVLHEAWRENRRLIAQQLGQRTLERVPLGGS